MDKKAADFLSSLGKPRYSSPDRDPKAPLVLTGMLDGRETTFFASPADTMSYGRELHRRAAAGELGKIGDYRKPEPLAPLKRRAET